MTVVSISTELPLPAAKARTMAAVPDVMLFVLAPVLSFDMREAPPPGVPVEPGFTARGRVRWLGVIPTWTHEISVRRLDEREIYTNERGGPVRVWNHRLTFEPLGPDRCRYTDEVEVEDGARGALAALFVRAIFRHRHRRWRTLAAAVSATE
ncbi:hypothetical protein [Tsukamurella sp. 1534]|uniref:hypothetical protein n=1 Tax=Tsukamurella sp. 1534 TaxID=1151061 RepID=UPI00059378FE|nr:hypothetical protein [Tsukamurella sp. 1534]